MKQWITVDTATGLVKGWHRSGKATELPVAPDGVEFIEATDTDLEKLSVIQRQIQAEGRVAEVFKRSGAPSGGSSTTLTNAVLELTRDTRPLIRVVIAAEIEVNTPVSLTATKVNNQGVTDITYSDTVITMWMGEPVRLVFVSGVASRTISPGVADSHRIDSNVDFRVEEPVRVTVYR